MHCMLLKKDMVRCINAWYDWVWESVIISAVMIFSVISFFAGHPTSTDI
jgi:hypothetical protein